MIQIYDEPNKYRNVLCFKQRGGTGIMHLCTPVELYRSEMDLFPQGGRFVNFVPCIAFPYHVDVSHLPRETNATTGDDILYNLVNLGKWSFRVEAHREDYFTYTWKFLMYFEKVEDAIMFKLKI